MVNLIEAINAWNFLIEYTSIAFLNTSSAVELTYRYLGSYTANRQQADAIRKMLIFRAIIPRLILLISYFLFRVIESIFSNKVRVSVFSTSYLFSSISLSILFVLNPPSSWLGLRAA